MTACQCGHPRHHHPAGGQCVTIRIFGDATKPNAETADAELHMGRWQRQCPCQQFDEQPATGVRVDNNYLENTE